MPQVKNKKIEEATKRYKKGNKQQILKMIEAELVKRSARQGAKFRIN